MNKLTFSSKGLGVLGAFHQNKIVIYVEEADDKLFWSKFFSMIDKNNYYFEIAGCKSQLMEIYKRISEVDTNILIFCDNDYSEMTKYIEDNRVFYTYAYSIENTLYCPRNVSRIISNICRDGIDSTNKVSRWYTHFSRSCKNLIVLDLASMKFKKGIEVMGLSSGPYVHTTNNWKIDKRKVNQKISEVVNLFTLTEISNCELLINKNKKSIRHIIRGHFITLALINMIKKEVQVRSGKTIKMANESLFLMAVDGCSICRKKDCADYSKIIAQLEQFETTLSP